MNQDIYVVIEHLQEQVADISYVMLAAAQVLARAVDGRVVAVLLSKNAKGMVADFAADEMKYVDHARLAEFTPDVYRQILADQIRAGSPRAVLFGETTIGTDLAGVLSVRLGIPLISQCRSVHVENGDLRFVSQICGGKMMVEGSLPDTTTLITMVPGGFTPEQGQSDQPLEMTALEVPIPESTRVILKRYIMPEVSDVDISKERVLISIGRGIQREDNIELAEELAEALGGVVSASRPVVDQRWLPISRMVGKSGQKVRPVVYLALGISGAPEHVEGMAGSQTIIAVNTDPAAPIFDVAKYGIEIDLFDLLPVLTERIQEAKLS